MAAAPDRRRQSLSVNDQEIRALARRLNWRPETLLARLQQYLPAQVEQNLYTEMYVQVEGTPARPRDFARTLRYFTGGRIFNESDLYDKVQGENLTSNWMSDVVECLYLTFTLHAEVRNMGYSVSRKTLERLVMAYGEEAQEIVEIVVDNLYDIMSGIRARFVSRPQAMAVILQAIARHAAETEGKSNMPNPASPEEIVTLLNSTPAQIWFVGDDDPAVDVRYFGNNDEWSAMAWSPEGVIFGVEMSEEVSELEEE